MPDAYDATTRKWKRSDSNGSKKKNGAIKVGTKRTNLKKGPKKDHAKLRLKKKGRGAAGSKRRF